VRTHALALLRNTSVKGLGLKVLQPLGSVCGSPGDYETLLEQLRQPAPTRREDVTGIGSALTYVGEGIGQSGPEMLAPLAASAAGTIVGGPAIGLGAGAVTAFPTFFGGNIQRQEDEVAAGNLEGVDVQGALVSALGQSALNSVGDKLLLGGFLKPGQKWLTRTAVGFGEGAAVEIPTEIAQQMLERRQAGLALDSDDAISEYIDAGILGGIMGVACVAPLRCCVDLAGLRLRHPQRQHLRGRQVRKLRPPAV